MNNLDRFLEVRDRVFPLLEGVDPGSLGRAKDALILPYVSVQLAFSEKLCNLGSLPDSESVRSRFCGLVHWFVPWLVRIAERAKELEPHCGENVRAISACIQETAVASILLLEIDDVDFLPDGMESVFAELRDEPFAPQNAEYLRTLGVPPDPGRIAALFHVLDRPPRKGDISRWKVIAERDPAGFRDRWLASSAWRCMKDFEQRSRLPAVDRDRGDIETFEAVSQANADTSADTEVVAASDEDRKALDSLASNAGLSPREREVVYRRHLLGQRFVDIAAELGVAPGTVRSTNFRAKKKLPKPTGI
jgi:RNA polymerase sigma factor (sigma-70 family)